MQKAEHCWSEGGYNPKKIAQQNGQRGLILLPMSTYLIKKLKYSIDEIWRNGPINFGHKSGKISNRQIEEKVILLL